MARFTKDEFMAMAARHHFCCGDHYVVYADGSLQKFSIFADCYDGFEYNYTPQDRSYQREMAAALSEQQSKTTIFEMKTKRTAVDPPITVYEGVSVGDGESFMIEAA